MVGGAMVVVELLTVVAAVILAMVRVAMAVLRGVVAVMAMLMAMVIGAMVIVPMVGLNMETALRLAILESPNDDLPKLVFADWLDEQSRVVEAMFVRYYTLFGQQSYGNLGGGVFYLSNGSGSGSYHGGKKGLSGGGGDGGGGGLGGHESGSGSIADEDSPMLHA
jgi:uncharacterized protein (TIGR02996 family)